MSNDGGICQPSVWPELPHIYCPTKSHPDWPVTVVQLYCPGWGFCPNSSGKTECKIM